MGFWFGFACGAVVTVLGSYMLVFGVTAVGLYNLARKE